MDGGSSGRRGKSSRNVLPRYKLGKTLGIGAFGKVKLAVHSLTGLKVAIKILDRQSIDNSEAEKVRKEINIMRQLFHPHVVRLFEVIDTPTKVYVVMEYMNSGELFYYITEHGRLEEDEARHFFQQIISGVEYCHHHMIVHRDLKPENLILDSKHNVKIADFGFGNVMRDGHFLKTSCGSPNYAAPELICRQLYAGPEVDVWSCGVILYALLCGRLPFDDDNIPGLYAKIKSGVYPVGNHLTESAQDLISRILVVDPMKRISIPEIRRHPWFMIRLPPYIANPSPDYLNRTEKVDIDVVKDVVRMGFDVREVIGSLQNHLQNEATVTYTMLLHNRPPVQVANHIQNQESLSTDNLQTYSESASHGQSNWTLGLKSQASPGETMVEILNVFHRLNVKWKRIGSYNMKCLWSPPPSRCSVAAGRGICIGSGDAVKFEIQQRLYNIFINLRLCIGMQNQQIFFVCAARREFSSAFSRFWFS
ncbi:SNF1-related protein kinase catalytic subunit alpha KIN10-like isoform X1 [Henckelia pumila]|uniref:SNF1-related protein kinase catalytic subunit alpha KIN10-like isoform X1 n=1 Tax=Henckelia pumila TaxID=405737 RepID=UPI003C6E2E6A